jgi:hypothetical protein
VIAALLLLGAVFLACRIHVRWGSADQRAIELQADEDTWADIVEHEAEQREVDETWPRPRDSRALGRR